MTETETQTPSRIYRIVPARTAPAPDPEPEPGPGKAVAGVALLLVGGALVWWGVPWGLALLRQGAAVSWGVATAEVVATEAVRWHLEEIAMAAAATAVVAVSAEKIKQSVDHLTEAVEQRETA